MKFVSCLLVAAFSVSCIPTANPNRDLCVAGASVEYQEAINVCKTEGLNYEACVSKYDIEKNFENKQKECR